METLIGLITLVIAFLIWTMLWQKGIDMENEDKAKYQMPQEMEDSVNRMHDK